jgi:hypothetical protein
VTSSRATGREAAREGQQSTLAAMTRAGFRAPAIVSGVGPIHVGRIPGALQTWEASVTLARLAALALPDLCLAQPTRQVAAT